MQAYSMDLRVRVMADVDPGVGHQGDGGEVSREPGLGPQAQAFSAADRQLCGSATTRVARHQARCRIVPLGAVGAGAAGCHAQRVTRGLGRHGGVGNGVASLEAFADHFQKKRSMPWSNSDPTSQSAALLGPWSDAVGSPITWSLSMRVARGPIWFSSMDIACAAGGVRPARSLENHNLRRRPPRSRPDGADGARRRDERQSLLGLRSPSAGAHTRTGRSGRAG